MTRPSLRQLAPVAVALAALVIFLATQRGQHTHDALTFANAIRANLFLPTVFRPHNLLYLPSAIAFHRSVLACGLPADPIFIGQIWSALWGAVALGLLFATLRRFLNGHFALLLTLLCATSNSVWSMATEVEVYTVSLAAVAGLYLALARRHPPPVLIGVLWGVAVVAHLTNALLIFPLLCHALCFRRERWLKFFATEVLWGVTVAGGAYAVASMVVVGSSSPMAWWGWVVSYAGLVSPHGLTHVEQFALGPLGLKRGFVDGPAKALMIFHAVILLISAVFALRRAGIRRRAALVLLTHALVNGLFFSWWEPLNIEFWLVTVLVLCLLTGVGRCAMSRGLSRWTWSVALLGALGVQLLFNARAVVSKIDPTQDVWMQQAREIAEAIEPDDLVVTLNDALVFTLPLAADHHLVTALEMEAFNDPGAPPDLARAADWLHDLAITVRAGGGEIFVTRGCVEPLAWRLQRLAISREEYDRVLRRAVGSDLTEPLAGGLIFR